MSYATKEAASAAAMKAIDKMKMGMWSIRVHENSGWHASIQWKYFSFSIFPPKRFGNRYILLIGYNGTGIGTLDAYYGNDPNAMLKKAIPKSIKQLEYYAKVASWLKTLNKKLVKT